MRVYEVMADGHYGNGLAIVAAPSRRRALALTRGEGDWWAHNTTLSVRCLRGVAADRKKSDVLSAVFYQE